MMWGGFVRPPYNELIDIRDPDFDDEPYVIGQCKHCGQDVRSFEPRVEFDGDMYHYYCLDGMSTEDVILELGGKITCGELD